MTLEVKLIASAVLAIVLGILFALYRHSLIAEGEQKIVTLNTKQAQALQEQADDVTKKWQAKAEEAEHSHDNELATLRQYRDEHPIVGLCLDTPGSAGYLPPAAPAHTGHAAKPAASVLQSVPARDPDVAPSRGKMLDAFGALADQQSARLRRWQGTVAPAGH